MDLNQDIKTIPGIGPSFGAKLKKLDIKTIADLWWHLPYRYLDFSNVVTIKNLKTNELVTIRGKIQMIATRRAKFKRRMSITEALIKDNTASLKAIWFNQPYITNTLKSGDEIYLSGKVSNSSYGPQMEQPNYEKIDQAGVNTGRLVPFYHLTNGLSHHLIRKTLSKIINTSQNIIDWLPENILKTTGLPKLASAIINLHFPKNKTDLINSRKRLAFNELFLINIQTRLARQSTTLKPSPIINFSEDTKKFVTDLPWHLTDDQKICAWEIIKDLGKQQPMYRLLQGDVGSGKTVVAGLAAFNACSSGWQVILLAPTEILAEQHYQTLSNLFKNTSVKIGLYTRGQKLLSNEKITANKILNLIKNGQINIIIGTHALLEKKVELASLGLIIIDEQHRFGVKQRQTLLNQPNHTPHLLSLTATPIPRSLALSIYGDLDISIIKTLPKNRKKIITKIIKQSDKNEAYNLIRQEVKNGHRIFVVCPLIDENDEIGVKAATSEHLRLQKEIFPDIKIGLLHGQLNSETKNQVMADFKKGLTPILVATSVIEVGVDVSEATTMLIEDADRFGTAQLHQFRGRVGRSDLQSYCLLFTNDKPSDRLNALVKYSNGFDLAEFDLKSRGPGSLIGEIQSGFGELKFANLADIELLTMVRKAANKTLEIDNSLNKFPDLKKIIELNKLHPE